MMVQLSLVTTWAMLVQCSLCLPLLTRPSKLHDVAFAIVQKCASLRLFVVHCVCMHTARSFKGYTLARCVCQGMKIVKCAELPNMWDYRKKQEGKVKSLEALMVAASGADYADIVEDTTGDGRTKRPISAEMIPLARVC